MQKIIIFILALTVAHYASAFGLFRNVYPYPWYGRHISGDMFSNPAFINRPGYPFSWYTDPVAVL